MAASEVSGASVWDGGAEAGVQGGPPHHTKEIGRCPVQEA